MKCMYYIYIVKETKNTKRDLSFSFHTINSRLAIEKLFQKTMQGKSSFNCVWQHGEIKKELLFQKES